MRKLIASGFATAALTLAVPVTSFATDPHTGGSTGQPNQSCQAEPSSPGNASSAPGSAFNEDPGGTAGGVYAGNGQTLNTPANGHAVSQYDAACYQVSQH